ncbi:hypothetical protein V493_02587 [Pseudogymnoascus sp. VKM F-4281 (FW-2241)]|nr:hypothetical protein V493_02587 [Pseudogymnoascus sp. VKM F-4281 (FW-2241)]
MKYLAAIFITALVAGVNSAAIAQPEAFCHRPGQPCGKVKRAAEAFAEALSEPIGDDKSALRCWRRPKNRCGRAKSTAMALADALANANPDVEAIFDKLAIREAFPEPEFVADAEDANDNVKREAEAFCHRPGRPCGKAKREAEAAADAEAEAFCHRPGQPCGKLKRAAEAMALALAEPVSDHEKREAEAVAEAFCHRPGQPCGKAKREAEAVAEAFCHRPGQPCGKAKRDVDALAEAAAEAIASFDDSELDLPIMNGLPEITTFDITARKDDGIRRFWMSGCVIGCRKEAPMTCTKGNPKCKFYWEQ